MSTLAVTVCIYPQCTRPHSTSNSQCILMLLVAGEEHVGAEVFTGELLPRRRQVFLLVHSLHLHVQYYVEKLWILLRRVTCIQLWSERKEHVHERKNVKIFFPVILSEVIK